MASMNEPSPRVSRVRQPGFITTRWSLVASAGRADSPESAKALEDLCGNYWYPIYAYLRRRGVGPTDAQDLTQEFFAQVLEKQYLASADRERGRFRTFLLVACQRFLAKYWRGQQTQKRGGGRPTLNLGLVDAEDRYQLEPGDPWTPEKIFERRWALSLLDEVMHRLESEYRQRGHEALFQWGKAAVTGGELDYADLSQRLEMSEGAIRVAVHRLRQRYRELLREEVRGTLDAEDDVDDELQYLRAALRGENF